MDDVIEAINVSNDVSITVAARGRGLVISDTSGSSTSNLIVADAGGGQTVQDLEIAKSVAADILTGDEVYVLDENFSLDQLNDGNAVRLFAEAPDIRITLTDQTVIEINLDSATTLGQIIDLINNDEASTGKVSAALVDGRLELDDLTVGGSGTFAVEDINNAAVVRQLGLDTAAAGTKISGRTILAGLNSVLLTNLRSGQNIDQTGQLTLTDRTGITATIDLTGAESLHEVIVAVNAAESSGGTKLQLSARINGAGTGVVIQDTSGSTVSNLVVADLGSSTLATQLGIAVDAAQDSVDSGPLNLRYANHVTQINAFVPQSTGITAGAFVITDSAGNEATIEISDAVENIGDLLLRINAASSVSVTVELNETGDGFVLIDEAGGGELRVDEVAGTTAAELRLLGTVIVGGDGKQRINSRLATVIDVDDDDTLNDIAQKINAAGANATTAVIDDGSAFNSARLSLTAVDSGFGGMFYVVDGGSGLGLSTLFAGQYALLRVGGDVQSGFLISSDSQTFADVEILETSSSIVQVTVSRNTEKTESALNSFVSGFNSYIDTAANLTKFNPETIERGVLQGSGTVLRVTGRIDSLLNSRLFASDKTVRSLLDLGIRVDVGGKLTFDKDRLAERLQENPQAVADFFLDSESGFAKQAQDLLKSFTDPLTGTFKLEETALQDSVDSLNERIDQLSELLDFKRERLLQQFIAMERILGELTFQQQAISTIAPLSINPIGKGIF